MFVYNILTLTYFGYFMQLRTIKSFVLRAGRTSKLQQLALEQWLPEYELKISNQPWNLTEIFNRQAQTVVEIGFGMGSSLVEMALGQPELNFIGIEVHRAGVGSLVAQLHHHHINNVRVVSHDAVDVFNNCFDDDALAGVQIFFPDPWPKTKHHKRRLIQPEFVKIISKKIKSSGFIHCATDWENYAEYILSVLNDSPEFINTQSDLGYAPKPVTRPLTKFENRGVNLGHGVWDIIFNRV